MDMDQEFSKALDGLHHQIDQVMERDTGYKAVETTESWTTTPAVVKKDTTTLFLVRAFFVVFLLFALQWVYQQVQKRNATTNIIGSNGPESQPKEKEPFEAPLLQEDPLSSAELDYLLSVKRGPLVLESNVSPKPVVAIPLREPEILRSSEKPAQQERVQVTPTMTATQDSDWFSIQRHEIVMTDQE